MTFTNVRGMFRPGGRHSVTGTRSSSRDRTRLGTSLGFGVRIGDHAVIDDVQRS
jgi:hypothetical protein